MPGQTIVASITGSLDAKNIVMGLLKHAQDIAGIAKLGPTVPVPELTGTVAIQDLIDADEDLGEFEVGSGVNGAKWTNVSFDLKKDRVRLGASDESQFRSKMGDPLALQKASGGDVLNYKLEKKIIAALQTTPKTGATVGVWSTDTNNPLKDFAKASAALRPYVPDYCIMTPDVWTQFVGNSFTAKYAEGNPGALPGAIAKIPGLGIDVYVYGGSTMTAKSCIVGCSKVPSFVIGNGPVKVREWDDPNGGTQYQVDVWRQVKSTILKDSSGLNKGAYVLTGVIA